MKTANVDIEYRDIARMLAKALPVEGDAYKEHVDTLVEQIRALPVEARNALKAAFIFSAKVPREEREDMFQELFAAVWESKTSDMPLAYAIARCDWKNWWAKYYTRQHYQVTSLNEIVDDGDGGQCELADLIAGESEFEAKLYGEWEATRIFSKLPPDIQRIVNKRLLGQRTTGGEIIMLRKWAGQHGHELLLQDA